MKFYCVCPCGEHTHEEATIEFNFRDGTVRFVCPKCKKEQVLNLRPARVPLPSIGRMRR